MNVFLEGFANALKEGGRVEVKGFGRFSVRDEVHMPEAIQGHLKKSREARKGCRFLRQERN